MIFAEKPYESLKIIQAISKYNMYNSIDFLISLMALSSA
jgi:hypothetical protein